MSEIANKSVKSPPTIRYALLVKYWFTFGMEFYKD